MGNFCIRTKNIQQFSQTGSTQPENDSLSWLSWQEEKYFYRLCINMDCFQYILSLDNNNKDFIECINNKLNKNLESYVEFIQYFLGKDIPDNYRYLLQKELESTIVI